MAELAVQTKGLDFKLEQVQDFTATPMTVATTIYATGYHPYSLKPVYVARSEEEKRAQNLFFFWYKSEYKEQIINQLNKLGRKDLIQKLYNNEVPAKSHNSGRPKFHKRRGK